MDSFFCALKRDLEKKEDPDLQQTIRARSKIMPHIRMQTCKPTANAPHKRLQEHSRSPPRATHCRVFSAPPGCTENGNQMLVEKLRDIEVGFTGSICSLAVSPDGNLIAAGSDKGRVKVQEVATGYQSANLPESSKACRWLKWSPGGERLAVCSDRGPVWVWNMATGGIEGFEGYGDIAWSPDRSELCALVSDRSSDSSHVVTRYKIYNLASGATTRSYENTLPYLGGGKVFRVVGVDVSWQSNGLLKAVVTDSTSDACMIIEPGEEESETSEGDLLKMEDNRCYMLFSFNPENTLQAFYDTYCEQLALFCTRTGRKKYLPGHTADTPDCVLWSPDGNFLATCSLCRANDYRSTTVRVWSISQGRMIVSFDLMGTKCPMIWSSCSKLLFCGWQNMIRICNMDVVQNC